MPEIHQTSLKLSIITINLNNAEGLQKTIESVVKQTDNHFEFIVIDGGSLDSSVDVIKQFSSRVKYWVSEPDTGIYNAMNKGIKRAVGRYCLFLNSGDYLTSKWMIEKIFTRGFSEDFIYCDIEYNNENGSKISTSLPDKLPLLFFYTSSLWHQATFIKRSLFDRFGLYNESNILVSDWEFFLKRIIFDRCSYKKVNEVVTFYDMYNGLSVKNNALRLRELEKSIEQNIPRYVKELLDDYLILDSEIKLYKKSFFLKFIRQLNKLKNRYRFYD